METNKLKYTRVSFHSNFAYTFVCDKLIYVPLIGQCRMRKTCLMEKQNFHSQNHIVISTVLPQDWLQPQLSRWALDIYGYEEKNHVQGTVVDKIIIVMTVNFLKCKITLCGVVNYWATDEDEGDDIILGFMGADLYVDTQVGVYHLAFLNLFE